MRGSNIAESILDSNLFGSGGLGNFFGDGSDGAFNPATILANGATAPNGGTVANLWDMNASTIFTTGNLPAAADQVILLIDFGSPGVVLMNPGIYVYNALISVGANRTFEIQQSNDNISWTAHQNISVSTVGADKSLGGNGVPTRYWRLVLKAGGSDCTFSCQGITLNQITGTTQTNLIWRILLPATAHSGLVVKQFTSLTLPAGYTLSTDNPCRGLVIYVQGDANISGSIDMSQKAGLAPNREVMPMLITKTKSDASKALEKYLQLTTVLQVLRGGAGGNGGYGGGYVGGAANIRSNGGVGGNGRINAGGFGGGGGGGTSSNSTSSKGGNGGNIDYAELGNGYLPSFSLSQSSSSPSLPILGLSGQNGGGGGGGAQVWNTNTTAITVTVGGGGRSQGGGGGGGGGAVANSTNAAGGTGLNGQYAGGCLVLVVGGDTTINAAARLLADGGAAGNGGNGSGIGSGGGGGGGSGGGVIALYYKGVYTNNGTIQVNGGAGAAGGSPIGGNSEAGGAGTAGSVGTIHVQQIA